MKQIHAPHIPKAGLIKTPTIKVASLIVFFFCIVVLSSVHASPQERLLGKWYTEGKAAVFDFYKVGNEYKARMYPLKTPDLRDTMNPVDSLKGRKLSGVTTIYGLIFNAQKKQWEQGRVYNPGNGKVYSCNCKLSNGNLIFRGYLGVSLLGQSQVWTRVPEGIEVEKKSE